VLAVVGVPIVALKDANADPSVEYFDCILENCDCIGKWNLPTSPSPGAKSHIVLQWVEVVVG
jgi:hypothetical protein